MASVLATSDMAKIVTIARAGFMGGKTRTKEARRRNLEGILQLIKNHREDMIEAQRKDLNKPSFETIIGEVELAKAEATDFLQRLDEIMGKTDVNDGSLLLLRKQAFVHRDPYGVCLVIGAWNYPIQLVLVPLIGAIAAGNAVVVKPSELSPACAELFARIIPQYLDTECYPVVNGGAEVAQALLKQRFDHILYTGGCNVAKIIMRAAAENLTPVTLELGGKCPAYVDSTGDVKSAARRISWGKFMNSGQTCVAPDYVMCHETLKDKLISELKRCLRVSYGDDIKSSQDYGRMVSQRHFDRVQTLLQQSEEKVVFGGSYDRSQRYIEPTLLDNVTFDDTIMGEEIFGPILPIVSVQSAEEAIRFINSREKPLALYVFSSDKRINNRFLTETSSGNLTVNETMIHVGAPALPFGGVGNSGMGAYHGKFSIDTFSHKKSCIVDPSPKQSELTMGIRYPPYSSTKQSISCLLMRTATVAEKRILKLLKYAIVVALFAYGIRRLKYLIEILWNTAWFRKNLQQAQAIAKMLGLDGIFHG